MEVGRVFISGRCGKLTQGTIPLGWSLAELDKNDKGTVG